MNTICIILHKSPAKGVYVRLCHKSQHPAYLRSGEFSARIQKATEELRIQRDDSNNSLISSPTVSTGLSASMILHLPIEARQSAFRLIRLNSSKLSNISLLLRSCCILLYASSGLTSRKNIRFDVGTVEAKK